MEFGDREEPCISYPTPELNLLIFVEGNFVRQAKWKVIVLILPYQASPMHLIQKVFIHLLLLL